MGLAPVKIERFHGVRNVGLPEDARAGDLQVALNVDVDNRGRLRRRMGHNLLISGAVHSVMTDGTDLLFREGAALKRLNKDLTVETLRSDFGGTQPCRSLLLNGLLYYSDGETAGVYQSRVSRTFGLAVPPAPAVSGTAGDLTPGSYGVALAYLRTDGQESGSSPVIHADGSAGGFTVAVEPSSDPTVDGIGVYVTAADGEVLYRQAVMPNEQARFTISGGLLASGVELETQHCDPAPPWHLIAFYRGRLFMAVGDAIVHSEPLKYELVRWDHAHARLQGEVTMLLAVENGLWVGTDRECMFLSGEDPMADGGLRVKSRIASGAIKGVSAVVDGDLVGVRGLSHGPLAVWASSAGVFVGDGNGMFVNPIGSRWAPPKAAQGTVFVRKGDGLDQLVMGLVMDVGRGSMAVTKGITGQGG